ncbi:hypothetical protein QC762_0035690 [Podospora pseudocomata]|uniref:Uncharacterized protein n=3 Tax=Podospora TaxID=5144 RepID=A0ABR0HP89_9PEZI|nr:hypothetical protein QC762_0035690 [Podospora pseudocomata]KAK4669608.1 hypothetical protein QC763_0034270 [Podospora pseudopauciseta]KAK4679476.1 hypothetical protein QC764_0035150 [Podospora pseudoanserina]
MLYPHCRCHSFNLRWTLVARPIFNRIFFFAAVSGGASAGINAAWFFFCEDVGRAEGGLAELGLEGLFPLGL